MAKSRSDIERQYNRIIWNPQMTKERYDRASEVRKRYLDNIYGTRRSQSDRKRIRQYLSQGGQNLSQAMDDIMTRKYERNTYMGIKTGG